MKFFIVSITIQKMGMLLLTVFLLITLKKTPVNCCLLMQMSSQLTAQAVSQQVLTLRSVAGVTGLRTLASIVRRTLSGTGQLEQIKMGSLDLLMTMTAQPQVILLEDE